ncbi:MAG: hypothetical protein Q7T11_00460 [Deltaproteobacteria bacterium]|nr:hypothetical protein [Deltaproteobacteria bacterium]
MKNKFSYFLVLFLAFGILACGSTTTADEEEEEEEEEEEIPSTTGVSTTSGGMATINTGSSVVGFIPVGATLLAIPLDTGSSDSSLMKYLVRKTSISTAIDFDIDSCSADATDLQVVCVGYDSSKVAIVDVSTYISLLQSGDTPTEDDLVVTTVDLGNTESGSFSGGACINCGVLCDAGDSRFIVSSGDGYRVLNYSGTVLDSYLTDATTTPARNLSTENFSYDAVDNWVISPEYDSGNNYLWLIDVDTDTIYRWETNLVDISVDATNGIDGLLTNLGLSEMAEPDAAAIDPTTKILSLSDESAMGIVAINLGAAVFDDTADTFTAPATAIEFESIGTRLPGLGVEASSHLLFLEEEFSSGMGVAALPTSVSTSSGAISVTDYNWASVPDASATCPDVSFWTNAGDPHGLALFTGVIDDKPKGLLINDTGLTKNCAAVVDLEDFLAATKTTGTNQVDSSVDLVATGVVTFISLE